MRIALVTDWFHPRVGGIEVHVLALARRLQAAGCHVTVITPWPGEGEVQGVPVVRLDVPIVPGLDVCLSPLKLTRALRKAVADGGFDLAHGHVSFGSTAIFAGGWVANRVGLPAMATFHSSLRWLGWIFIAAQPILRWRRWPFRATAVSDRVAKDLAWIMPEREVTLLPCAIDPEAWLPPAPVGQADVGSPGPRLRLVTTARLQRRKRLDALLRILREVKERVGDEAAVTLEILGDGPDGAALERLAERLGLRDAVRFLGPGGADDVRTMLGRGDVFVNVAELESFGIAGLEALSCGVPVAALAQSGMSSFVRDADNGILVESDEAMVDALAFLATDPERLDRLREGAARGIPQHLTWDHLVRQHLEIYREMLGPASSR